MMTVEFKSDDGRRVYSVPVKLMVECTLFVLALDADHAKDMVGLVDLQDYFGFDQDSLTTDGEALLKINDVVTHPIDTRVVDITELSTAEYAPNTHPDFVGVKER
jgi:hypothetical protein